MKKRASLHVDKVPHTISHVGSDVTDRLLDRESPPAAAKSARTPPPPVSRPDPVPPKADTDSAGDKSAPGKEPLSYVPYRTVPEPPPAPPRGPQPSAPNIAVPSPAPKPLAEAVAKTEAAIVALQSAAHTAPAQYDLALRYRLDALAHHLEQVAEFVRGRVS